MSKQYTIWRAYDERGLLRQVGGGAAPVLGALSFHGKDVRRAFVVSRVQTLTFDSADAALRAVATEATKIAR